MNSPAIYDTIARDLRENNWADAHLVDEDRLRERIEQVEFWAHRVTIWRADPAWYQDRTELWFTVKVLRRWLKVFGS